MASICTMYNDAPCVLNPTSFSCTCFPGLSQQRSSHGDLNAAGEGGELLGVCARRRTVVSLVFDRNCLCLCLDDECGYHSREQSRLR
jgi:hypothetical protein